MVPRLRILTYNIHKCRGLDSRVRPDRIVDVLRELDADIIALQEVVSISGRHEHDQARYIASELGYNSCFGYTRDHNDGVYGNLLISRLNMRTVRNHNISIQGREQRGVLHAEIDWMGKTLQVFNVHLGTGYIERRRQVRKLFYDDILHKQGAGGLRIVLGDFNEWTRGLTSQLLHAHFKDADASAKRRLPRTFPGLFPFLHLDHIYFDPALKAERVTRHRSKAAIVASDHLPLVADFQIDLRAYGDLQETAKLSAEDQDKYRASA